MYWYKISDNSVGSLYELFQLVDCVFLSTMKTYGLILQNKVHEMTSTTIARDKWIIFISQYELSNIEIIMSKTRTVIDDKLIRKNLIFVRIGNTSSSSNLKAIT